MSGQLRTLKNRIRSVESTKKITRAMEMVAASKLHRFQDMMVKARPYTEGLEKLLKRLGETEKAQHPFFEKREEKRTALLLMTSDTGLCGSYNNDLIGRAKAYLSGREGKKPLLIGVGKIGVNSFKRLGWDATASYTDIKASRIEEILADLKATLEKLFLENQVDAIDTVYSHFLSVTNYQTVTEKLLPFEGAPRAEAQTRRGLPVEYIFEPSKEFIFEKLVPLYFEAKVRTLFLESFVSEQIARMRAMHQATENAKEMIDTLVLLRNKARQAAITKEIIEIVSGSQALKLH